MDRLLSMRVFARVVDEGSFAAASRALDLSAAAVTRLVADLEDHLGTRLLHRTTRRVSLTEAGQSYLSRLRDILRDIDEAEEETSTHTHELAGTLRVHAPPVLASYVVAPILAEFRRQHPKIVIDIDVETTGRPPIEDFDITLLGTQGGYDADVVARKVIDSEAILVASPGYLSCHGTPHEPTDLARHDCLRLKLPNVRPGVWRLWRPERPRDVHEIEAAPVLLANHTDTLMRAALDGAGITSVSVDMAAPYLTRGDVVRVLAPWITGRLAMYAALPSRKFVPRRTRVFMEYLIEETRKNTTRALQACEVCGEGASSHPPSPPATPASVAS